MRRVTLLCTLFVLLALPLTALAQRTTGDLRGVVTDESGAVLPGVTVTIRGEAVPGAPTTVTIGGQKWQKLVCNVDGQPAGEAAAVTYKSHIFTINTLSIAGTYATDVPQFFQPMEQSFAFTS